jgi:cytochrome oxidase Cu insertion factor (SCO1/SenC/PrrC family)
VRAPRVGKNAKVNRRGFLALLAAVAVLLGTAAGWLRHADASRNLAYDFTLTDQDGRPFRLSDERGHAVALVFGYTYCPDECPATLARLASARASLGGGAEGARVVFITIDPQRDTPQRLKRYLAAFDPSFIGLTGSELQLAPVYRAYHVWFGPLPKSGAGPQAHDVGQLAPGALPRRRSELDAVEAHTSTIYIVDRRGRFKAFADWGDSARRLAQALRAAES